MRLCLSLYITVNKTAIPAEKSIPTQVPALSARFLVAFAPTEPESFDAFAIICGGTRPGITAMFKEPINFDLQLRATGMSHRRFYPRIPQSKRVFRFLDPGGLDVRLSFCCTIESMRNSYDGRCKYLDVIDLSEDGSVVLNDTHRLCSMHCSVAFGGTPELSPWDPVHKRLKLKIPVRAGRCQATVRCADDESLTTLDSVVPGRRARVDAKFAGAWRKDDGAIGYTWTCESLAVEGAGTFS